ncbi:hydantoinase/oxoprolinase family protein [Nonomuraea fuscirosea]|uniref:hydantoinase/oxoprolinase family protein n=1 Tax=Nonomuraea fuscirosea TaxID=1291556 RepID=UPI002DD9EC41|nr:hydantoinase/oxoprolinase family protein [Nonomuraea fuscirosea]WSA48703.1 hydantoinase/oxoprolinase family protein [Nonomuraea fuscirosea]
MNARTDLSVGIDVGGTNTDAVVISPSGEVIAWTKSATTGDVTAGIRSSLAAVLDQLGPDRGAVSRVMLGTTHATNAIVRRRDLGRVAVIRLGAPASTVYPPLAGWPADLRQAVLAGYVLAGGGHLVDGYPIAELDRDAVRRLLDELDGRFDAVAVCGIFSPSFPEQELEVEALVQDHVGVDVPISLSSEIGALGLLERENATVLNAALYAVARDITSALTTVVVEHGLDAATFFAQNDGTFMAVEYAARYPVLTIGSGPANSIRGAAALSGADDAIVIDVGGTTSDLGVLVGRFPRESTLPREVGGVRTNFRMPDILSLGVGGGTIVDVAAGTPGTDSVGYRIAEEALLFGGSTPTLTDAAATAGAVVAGRELPPLDRSVRKGLAEALAVAHDRIESAVERMSLGRTGLPLVVVGGGEFLVPDRVLGASEVVRPERGAVANAVGAAIALAGGRADRLCAVADRVAAIEEASKAAIDKAVQAGADPARVEVIDVLETPVTYVTQPTLKVAVKAAGPVAHIGRKEPT